MVVEEPSRRSVGILMKHGSDRWIREVNRARGLAFVPQFSEVNTGSEAAAIFREPTAVEEVTRVEEKGLADPAAQVNIRDAAFFE